MDDPASAPAPMSYTQSFSQAQDQGKSFIKSTIGQHPSTAGAVMGVLILLVLILAFALVHYKNKSKTGFEGLAAAPPTPPKSPCPPGYTLRTDGTSQYCVPGAYTPDMSTCKAAWDPAASAEAQALATVGSLQHDSYGERRLQGAINAAYDSNIGLTDAQLQELMHQGGTP
jgi:hypothetical protein